MRNDSILRFLIFSLLPFVAATTLHAAPGDPIYAPDPGPPPAGAQILNPLIIIVAILVFTAALLFAVSAYVRGRIRRKTLYILTGAILILSWSGLLIAMINAPPSEDYEEWKEAHQMWKDKEIIGREK